MIKKQKNTSKFIQILKEYETIITAFFVLFFMLLFCFIGYYSLRVQNKSFFSSLQSENTGDLTLSSSTVTLTTQDSSMPDSIGLQYHKYGVSIENKNSKDISYELIFEINSNLQRKCGCSFPNFNYSMIHYSIDQKDVLTFIDDNMIVLHDRLLAKEKKDYIISMWLEDGLSIYNYHVHGNFRVKEIS